MVMGIGLSPREYLAKIQELITLEARQNDGRGIQCVKAIIAELKNNRLSEAITIADNEADKLRNYPEIVAVLNLIRTA